ncbi:hypothetical protein SERLADRAFT_475955 [Serpula lacrymans var. lacrymans S7.9]|uniref:Inositol-pentakisphosphate 2-kinase n=1 Tax=Serpula lacrymans var. lacrymans (strain S7.9) TaxID=578457 RepID=F8P6U3_SERL9|nr:uncharacterized protein SERLADRAFT_475955 [Serpula lacrymans var. lacrymans S7.9]EGO21159.1 hypothetical protein SERLADRAFT_475955 [Serpula lacrymans var. lacrymans S7.9]
MKEHQRLHITDTRPGDWKYVAEGGATMVFSYTGPPGIFNRMVLRLRKSTVPDLPQRSLDDVEELDDFIISFQERIVARVISEEHLPRLKTVLLDTNWLQSLSNLRNMDRPPARRHKDGLDLTKRKGILATDLVGNVDLAIEIKPKWAFLPCPAHLSSATITIKRTTCRFCMHNYFRSTKNVAPISAYCPLDLYSGEEDRITRAIHDLWDAWIKSDGSLNNLRIFVHGSLLKPSDADSSRILADVLHVSESYASSSHLRDAFTSTVLRILLDSDILRVLSRLQRTLDPLDIEGLSKLWFRSKADLSLPSSVLAPALGFDTDDPSLTEWEDFIDIYTSVFKTWNHSLPNVANLKSYLMAYMLSATFKDCSIVLRPDKSGTTSASVTVIDMDPKSMIRLEKWEKLDKNITDFYTHAAEAKVCHDRFLAS